MPQHCVALRCKNRSKGRSADEPKITFHRFPQDKSLRKHWVEAIRRDLWSPSPYSRLCSSHFSDQDYVPDRQNRMLKWGAIPSKFVGRPAHRPKRTSTRRKLKRQRNCKSESSRALDDDGLSDQAPSKTPTIDPNCVDHNYAYPNDIDHITKHCNFLRKCLQSKLAQERIVKEKLKRSRSSVAKFKEMIDKLWQEDILSREGV
ncbi:hypothetical protein TCAL_08232 [Tigriopus californicus]|uniref:THAP-type domain-containing protein n=1 Tax=Tigriopus californicus TaxID=6832 RepID=A0A553NCE4_TIGCA|nr:THAP domain-containing protein 1-like [Tigriopus californicus]TRY63113.1 hypothetical protein TCAL_08232 [Tigriopus californicus]|eukprot:TCALIF_08232-PA protein Name:"Similar to THAP1 THAP domain-containing protein 1 (Macaca fascicularis)" AED:0.03 eAED:0.03 QI:52/1/1/1/1/1/2/504/202